jgi:sugar/nucleoside kinase (ribokinase family)
MSALIAVAPGRTTDVLCVGDPVADIVVRVPRAPAVGAKVVGAALGVWPGGTTANVACALGQLGRRAAVFGRTGGDPHGLLLRHSFRSFNVDMLHLTVDQVALSANAITMVDENGEKSLVYIPMRPAAFDPERFARAAGRAALVYAMPYDLAEFERLSALARQAGALVAIDIEAAVAPDAGALRARLALADIVFFNEAGFRAGTGQAPSCANLGALLDAGPQVVVVSLGARGALALTRRGCAHQPAFATEVVDTTGAGDSFNAAFLAALLRRAGLADVLRYACAAASFTVAALGARTNLPDHHQVSALAGWPAHSEGDDDDHGVWFD